MVICLRSLKNVIEWVPQRRKQVMKKKSKNKKPVETWDEDGWSQGQCLSQDEGTIFQAKGETGIHWKVRRGNKGCPAMLSLRWKCDLWQQLSSWSRLPFQCKFLLRKGNFYSVFRASPVSAVSQNNQFKIRLCQRGIFWGSPFCYPSLSSSPGLIAFLRKKKKKKFFFGF